MMCMARRDRRAALVAFFSLFPLSHEVRYEHSISWGGVLPQGPDSMRLWHALGPLILEPISNDTLT